MIDALENYDIVWDHDELQKQEFEFLDSISDLETYLEESGKSIHTIMNQIDTNCAAAYGKEPSIFSCITADDFIQYLKKRFKGKYEPCYYVECRLRKVE